MLCVEAAGGKLENGLNLFRRHMELFDDLVDARTCFKVLEYGGDGHASVAKDPCAAPPFRDAFDSRALRPVEDNLSSNLALILTPVAALSPTLPVRLPLESRRGFAPSARGPQHFGYDLRTVPS